MVAEPDETLSREEMLAGLMGSDASYNGRFITGVLSTGIYCLPSCRARKPKPENVQFFPRPELAREAGLRPCQKCRPDEFYRGEDSSAERFEAVVSQVRQSPGEFSDVGGMARAAGLSTSSLFDGTRRHFHDTPAGLLVRARVRWSQARLLTSDDASADIAFEAGFESLSTFHDNFRRLTGMSPGGYRQLTNSNQFGLSLPDPYPVKLVLDYLNRDAQSPSERLEGRTLYAATWLRRAPAVLQITFSETAIECRIHGDEAIEPGAAIDAHRQLVGLLGLEQDAAGCERLAVREGVPHLVAGREGLRIPQTLSAFDGLVWSIVGQQISLPFAFTLRSRLVRLTGTRVPFGLVAPPVPGRVAELAVGDLLPLQFSRRKAEYLIDASRQIVGEALTLEKLAERSATRAERTLLAVRGLGPWAANYLMMRSLGFADCLPIGDTGLTSGLQRVLKLDERPDKAKTQELMHRFSPYRSLTTYHLWQSLKEQP
jgi:AraC family transcriptional regulator of adaptative response / DNA-3-methyladenine glycosylase II